MELQRQDVSEEVGHSVVEDRKRVAQDNYVEVNMSLIDWEIQRRQEHQMELRRELKWIVVRRLIQRHTTMQVNLKGISW